MQLFDELDSTGATVRSGFALGMYDSLPAGHSWVPHVAPAPTQADLIADCTNAVQMHLDAMARTKDYDSMLSCVSYAGSANATFAAEAKAALAWRDACWSYCYQQLAAVQAGTIAAPTPAQLVAALPVFIWPV